MKQDPDKLRRRQQQLVRRRKTALALVGRFESELDVIARLLIASPSWRGRRCCRDLFSRSAIFAAYRG